MSRVEKSIEKKKKYRKFRFISKILFILFMSINLFVCVIVVDTNAKKMLGEETYSLNQLIDDINIIKSNITEKINK